MKTCFRTMAYGLLGGLAAVGVDGGAIAREASKPFGPWLDELRAEAARKGIRAQTLDEVIPTVKPIPRVIELDRRQPEFTLTLQQYMNRVVPNSRVRKGRSKFRENATLLTEIGRKFGVQPRFIVAFWAWKRISAVWMEAFP